MIVGQIIAEHKICIPSYKFFFSIVYIMSINVHNSWIKGQDSSGHIQAIEKSWKKLSYETKNILSNPTPYFQKEIPDNDYHALINYDDDDANSTTEGRRTIDFFKKYLRQPPPTMYSRRQEDPYGGRKRPTKRKSRMSRKSKNKKRKRKRTRRARR